MSRSYYYIKFKIYLYFIKLFYFLIVIRLILHTYYYKTKNIAFDYILVWQKLTTKNMVTYTGAIFGAIPGFIATWSISTATATSELESGQQIGTFYPIISIALGFNNAVNSAYLGFWPSYNLSAL